MKTKYTNILLATLLAGHAHAGILWSLDSSTGDAPNIDFDGEAVYVDPGFSDGSTLPGGYRITFQAEALDSSNQVIQLTDSLVAGSSPVYRIGADQDLNLLGVEKIKFTLSLTQGATTPVGLYDISNRVYKFSMRTRLYDTDTLSYTGSWFDGGSTATDGPEIKVSAFQNETQLNLQSLTQATGTNYVVWPDSLPDTSTGIVNDGIEESDQSERWGYSNTTSWANGGQDLIVRNNNNDVIDSYGFVFGDRSNANDPTNAISRYVVEITPDNGVWDPIGVNDSPEFRFTLDGGAFEVVPEPSSAALGMFGLLALTLGARKRS